MVLYLKGPQTQHKSICAGGSTAHGKWGPVYNWGHRGRPQAPPQVLGVRAGGSPECTQWKGPGPERVHVHTRVGRVGSVYMLHAI